MKTAPVTADLANSIGMDCAQEWLDRAPDAVLPPASLAAWRARCYADSVHKYEVRPDFLQLLAAWEQGFDKTVHSGAIAADQRPQAAPRALHQPFSWLHGAAKDDLGANLAALAMDMCRGIETCLEMVETSNLERSHNADCDPGDEAIPLLSPADTGRLLRMAMASARLLADKSEGHIDWACEYAGKERK